ncbi:hypothetical protein [Carboxylicivirga taeanensis]|uniref:hypothetical protein n=1 Tax=Carboxylicivirga taeanensis TaxID=1416875 RepID=UPI003F6DB204
MKTFLPYYVKKVGITLFFISFLTSFVGYIDESAIKYNKAYQQKRMELNLEISADSDELSVLLLTDQQRVFLKKLGFILALSGLLLYSFSKEKIDDEFLVMLRANALVKAFIVSWLIFAVIMLIKGSTKANLLVILQLQMLIYVIVYSYTKKIKYTA